MTLFEPSDTIDIETFAWSPDGSKIAFSEGATIYIWGVQEEKIVKELTVEAKVSYINWLPDGSMLIVEMVNQQGFTIQQLTIEDGAIRQVSFNANIISGRPKLSPSGDKIAFIQPMNDSYTIGIMNLDGADVKRVTNFPTGKYPDYQRVTDFDWSPDGEYLIFSSGHQNDCWEELFWGIITCPHSLYLVNLTNNKVEQLTHSYQITTSLIWLR
jgi:Tol biopolymer transport system component